MSSTACPAATALQLEDTASCMRYVRAVARLATDASVLSLFAHRHDVYSVHGPQDVGLAARLNIDDLRAVAQLPPVPGAVSDPLDTLHFNPRIARDLAVAALFTAGKKVHLYSVDGSGKITLMAQGSPGNLGSLEDSFLDSAALAAAAAAGAGPSGGAASASLVLDDGAVLAVKIGSGASSKTGRVIGVASWDATNRVMSMAEMQEDDVFSGLESVIVATSAKEAVFCDGDMSDFEKAKVMDVLEKCGVALSIRKRVEFGVADAPVDLGRLVGSHLPVAKFLDMKLATAASSALLRFLRLMADPHLEGRVAIRDLDHASFMQLDNAAIRALNILPFPGDGGKKGSLFGLLNRTKTAMGSRLLRRWLTQPLQDIDAINARLDITAAFLNARDVSSSARNDHLSRMPDLNQLCRRFTKDGGAKASLQDVVRLYQCSVRLPFLSTVLRDEEADPVLASRFSDHIDKLVQELNNFEALVETTIDLDQIDNGEFVVNPAIDPQLSTLRKQQDAVVELIDQEHKAVCRKIGNAKSDALKLERKDPHGYIFRLTRKEEKLIRGRKEFTVLETRKDGVRFQTSTLRRLARDYGDAAKEYQGKEREMRTKTLEVAATYMEVFLDVAALLAEMDVLVAFSAIAVESRSEYVRPLLRPAGTGLVLKQARHPIVEENMDDSVEFIANDMDLRRNVNDSDVGSTAISGAEGEQDENGGALLLVTGPNMGGKSTFIRTAGVAVLMAHIGAFVPAVEAHVPMTDRILARVGAGDNQHRAISTFMAEMLETASILRSATSSSLVIIDELGRGTGTMDGFGLAHAISKHIATELRSACLFATHFFELTALADSVASVRNVHVTAVTNPTNDRLTFLYEARPGACDQSFGVHVAEMAHFPASVVKMAKRKAAELEDYGAPSKKRKIDVPDDEAQEGRELIATFLADIRKLPLSTDKEKTESVGKARSMRQRVMAHNNRYISAILAEE